MKVNEITFQTLCSAVKHQWKRFLLVVLAFALLGAGTGIWYGDRMDSSAAGSADSLPTVDFSEIRKDAQYYQNCETELRTRCDEASAYLNIVSADSTLTVPQKELLKPYFKQLKAFSEQELQQLQATLSAHGVVYVPVEYTETLIREKRDELADAKLNLVSSEVAVELVKSMDAPDVENEATETAYGLLLAQATQYGNYQKTILQCEAILDRLTNQPEQVVADSRTMEERIREIATELESITASLHQTVQHIAQENHLDLLLTYNQDSVLQITLNHTYRASSTEETVAILTLFCVLTGICVGGFFAVYQESKMEETLRREKEVDLA